MSGFGAVSGLYSKQPPLYGTYSKPDSLASSLSSSIASRHESSAGQEQVSSWQGGKDEVNISEAARKHFADMDGQAAIGPNDPKQARMSATTRHGSEIVLEAHEVGKKNFTMGKFAEQGGIANAFDFSMTGSKKGDEQNLLYTLTVTSKNGAMQQHIISENTRLIEDNAGNISIAEQSDSALNGTDGQDILINIKDDGAINGGSGDDIIFNMGRNATVNGGDGNDVIVNMGSGSHINGGAGDDAIAVLRDTLRSFTEDRRVDAEGKPYVVGRPNGFEQVSIDGGDGNDFISTTDLYNSQISGGAGADTIQTGKMHGSSIDGGDGSDAISVKDMLNSTIKGGDGHDSIRVMGGMERSGIYGGSGDDTIAVTGAVKKSMIHGGEGNDSITVHAGGGDKGGVSGSKILGGDGDDVIQVEGDVKHGSVIDGGKGDDVIWSHSGTVFGSAIKGGDGDDKIYVDHVSTTDENTLGIIDGGKGNDLIVVGNSSGGQIFGGEGDDTIFVNKSGSSVDGKVQTVIDGGAGEDFIQQGETVIESGIYSVNSANYKPLDLRI